MTKLVAYSESIDGGTPLHKAAFDGTDIDLLLDAKADVNRHDNHGMTPLHIATQRGHLELVAELLSAGAKINEPTRNGDTPLFLSFENDDQEDHFPIKYFLILNGADVNARNARGIPFLIAYLDETISTSLWYHGYLVRQIILAGADLNAQDNQGLTALHYAVKYNALNLLKTLLKAGANPNIPAHDNRCPLELIQSREAAKLLIEYGAQIPESFSKWDKDALSNIHLESFLAPLFLELKNSSLSIPTPSTAILGRDWEMLLSLAKQRRNIFLDPYWFLYLFLQDKNLKEAVLIIQEYLPELADTSFSYEHPIELAKHFYNQLMQSSILHEKKINLFLGTNIFSPSYGDSVNKKIYQQKQPQFRKIKNIIKRLEEKALEKDRRILLVYGPLPLKQETEALEFLLNSYLYGKPIRPSEREGCLIGEIELAKDFDYCVINITKMLTGEPNWEHLQIFRNDDRKQKDLDQFFHYISISKQETLQLGFQSFIREKNIKDNNPHKGEILAFYLYTFSANKEINEFFRSCGKCALAPDFSKRMLSIGDIFLITAVNALRLLELPSNEETTKAIRFSRVSTSLDLIEAAQNSSIIYEKSFLSTYNFKSLFKNNAFPTTYKNSKQIIFIMDNFVAKSIKSLSKYPGEREILGPIGMRSICLAQDVDEEGRQFLVYKPISALTIKLRAEKIFDQRRLYAAMLLNKHYLYLIHFHDLYKGKNLLAANIWAALWAIVKGHSFFRCVKLIKDKNEKECAKDDPITACEELVAQSGKLINIFTNANNESAGLMDISPLLSLVDELPKLRGLDHSPPHLPKNAEACLGTDIPSYALFELIYQKVYSVIPGCTAKGFSTIQQIRTSERDSEIKDNNATKTILRKLGIPSLFLTQLLNFMEEEKFFIPEIIQIIISYMFTPSRSKSDYINIYKDSPNQQYLDSLEISALLDADQLIWKMQSKKAQQNAGYEQKIINMSNQS